MEKIKTSDGYIIEYTKLDKNEDPSGVVEGSVVGYEGWEKNLIIPSEFEYKDGEETVKGTVTSVGIGAFENYIFLESIKIPETVVSLGKFAFKKCDALNYIYIPGSVSEISDYCFVECTGLVTVEAGEGLKKIGDYSFSKCVSLENVNLPESFYFIGFSAFEDCKSLRNIEFKNKVKIGYFAFKGAPFEKKLKKM